MLRSNPAIPWLSSDQRIAARASRATTVAAQQKTRKTTS
jgi:hypothetical protein